jgi:hypothetical protein
MVVVQSVFANIAASIRDKNGVGGVMALISFIPVLMFIPVIILNWVGNQVFYLINMAISRKAEYRADAFAASLGYQAGMIEALEVFNGISARGNSFIDKLMATHPAPMQRIGALEDGEIQQTKLGSIKMAMPFAAGTTARELSDFAMLSIFVVGFGVAWCGYFTYNYLSGHPVSYKNNVYSGNVALNNVTHKNTQMLHIPTQVKPLVNEPRRANVLQAPLPLHEDKPVMNNTVGVNNSVTQNTNLYHVTSIKPIYKTTHNERQVNNCAADDDECETVIQDDTVKTIEGYNVVFKNSIGNTVTEFTYNRPHLKNYTLRQIKAFN